MDIVIDFDGTCVKHAFPSIGDDIGAVPVLKKLVENGHRLILFTMRSDVENPQSEHSEIVNVSGAFLTEAVRWFNRNGIELYGIQTNPSQKSWTHSPKAYGHLIIDDAALGCPLVSVTDERPYVDWIKVEKMLQQMGII